MNKVAELCCYWNIKLKSNWDENLHSDSSTLLKLRVICDQKGDNNFSMAVRLGNKEFDALHNDYDVLIESFMCSSCPIHAVLMQQLHYFSIIHVL